MWVCVWESFGIKFLFYSMRFDIADKKWCKKLTKTNLQVRDGIVKFIVHNKKRLYIFLFSNKDYLYIIEANTLLEAVKRVFKIN